jgi:hypothetical protein
MSKVHINHLKAGIKKLFESKIDLSDSKKKPFAEQEKLFLSRGLAAYTLYVLAGADINSAANTIIDGYGDNGIDAIFFDKQNKTLWLVQSKWMENGVGSPDNGDVKKFRDGARDIIELDFSKFNSKITNKINDIEEALKDYSVKIKLVIAFTGNQFSVHSKADLDQFIEQQNDVSDNEYVSYQIFNLGDAHRALAGSTDGQPISLDITLYDWGKVDDPIYAYYGIVSGIDIRDWWAKHRRRLFNGDIRSFIGDTDVNESIQETALTEPEFFWYFNNGVTILCKSIKKVHAGGSKRDIGTFHCEGCNVVNGAQTVGNIGSAYEENADSSGLEKIQVLVRLISLEDTQEHFDQRITKATNTQNKIEKRDFVTQDPEQERLKTELFLLKEKINYHYIRSDEKIPPDEENCTLEEATVALACSNPSEDLAVLAKRELGKLWVDIKSHPYTTLFNKEMSGLRLWRTIKVMREVNSFLKTKESVTTKREKSFYIHVNRLLLHLTCMKISENYWEDEKFDFDELLKHIIVTTTEPLAQEVWKYINSPTYFEDTVYQIFRNFKKCRDIKLHVLSQKETPSQPQLFTA